MRWIKITIISSMLILTLACQCIGPAYLIEWIQNHTVDASTPASTIITQQDNTRTKISSGTYTNTALPQPTETEIISSTAFPTLTKIPTRVQSATPNEESKSRSYDITETIELTNDGPGITQRIVIWVALIQTIDPYQVVDDFSFSTDDYEIVTDNYGNKFARIEIDDLRVGTSFDLEFSYQVTVNEIRYEFDSCNGSSIEDYLNAEKYIESNSPQIVSLAESLQQDTENNCEAARAIYDYIGDNFTYSEFNPDDVGALQALDNRNGDCTEFSDLFIALSRAADIPANFVEGVTCCTTNGYSSSDVQHDWAEIYLPENGWVPVDPTWGRFSNKRDMYFAQLPPDHIILTRGRNLDTLGGFHFYYYRYFWDGLESKVSSVDTWSILESIE